MEASARSVYDREMSSKIVQQRTGRAVSVAVLLVALAILPYLQTLGHDFLNYDDNLYVSENPHVQQGLTWQGLVWAFTTCKSGNWLPVTWLSHMLDVSLWGNKPGGHHFTNVLLHAANTLLLFLILSRMTGGLWRSALVAALFAVHPLHVEAVAWVAERKEVLSAFFGLLAFWAYFKYARDSSISRYFLVACLFVLGLMAKPMLVSLPFLLLLLDIWPLRRWRLWPMECEGATGLEPKPASRILLEKLPLFLIATIFCIIALVSQRVEHNISDVVALPLSSRVANAIVGYDSYFEKLIAPINLAVFYPHPGHWRLVVVAMSAVLLLIITAVTMLYRRQRPWLLIGWLWFIVTLIPVIGLVQVGWQSIADRYSYIPSIGIFIMAAWSIPLTEKSPALRVSIATACAVVVVFVVMTWRQISYWQNSRTLFEHAAQVTQGNFVAHQNLGNALEAEKDIDAALELYRLSAAERPKYAKTSIHENIANVLIQQQRYQDALAELRQAIEINPFSSAAFNSMGSIMLIMGQNEDAAKDFQSAAKFDADNIPARINYGTVLVRLGRWDEAIAELAPIVRAEPKRLVARTYFARALAGRGDFDQAIHELQGVLQVAPDYAPARKALSEIEAKKTNASGN